MIEFQPFPKIGRLSRDMIVSEKLDGTNAQVLVAEPQTLDSQSEDAPAHLIAKQDGLWLFAGSRAQWLKPEKGRDNFGFAAWVRDNASALVKLGPGRHFGEWWGQGIQRGYGLTEKRFSLFNVRRWTSETLPAGCCVVPTLFTGDFDTAKATNVMAELLFKGSAAAPGFMKPEGIVIFHTQSGALFKKTFDRDDAGKGKEPAREIAA